MIDVCNFTNLFGETWQFNTTTCPLKEYSVDHDIRTGDDIERMNEHGIWPQYTHVGKCLIHLTGDILRDSTADYCAAVILLKRILMPKDEKQVTRKLGTLTLQYTGQESMSGDVTLDGSPELPKLANYPTVGEFMITFKAFNPYFVGSSGRKYLI
jgi:hypothetical protein